MQHAVLVGEIVVFQFFLRPAQVANHHRVARIDHIGHPVVHPEGGLERELVARIVFRAEGVGHLCDAAIEGNVCHHVGIVAVEPGDTAHVVGQPGAHLAGHGEAALLGGNGAFTEIVGAVRGLEMHRQRSHRHPPGTGSHVGGHVERSALEVVAHVVLQVPHRQQRIGLNPQRQVVALVKLAIDIGQILVHLGVRHMVAEKTPHAGIGIAHVLKINRAIGITEREILVTSAKIAQLPCQRNHILGIHALHLRTIDMLQVAAADALE